MRVANLQTDIAIGIGKPDRQRVALYLRHREPAPQGGVADQPAPYLVTQSLQRRALPVRQGVEDRDPGEVELQRRVVLLEFEEDGVEGAQMAAHRAFTSRHLPRQSPAPHAKPPSPPPLRASF